MPVITSHSQGGPEADLRDHYRVKVPPFASDRQKEHTDMICLIDRLEQEFAKTTLWLLTSHDHLILMNTPTCEGERLVQVIGTYDEEYFVRYLVPETQSPFPGRAHVEGMALGQDEAMKYIRIAMRLSGGWPDSLELEH